MLVYSFWGNGFCLYDGNNDGLLTFDNPVFYSGSTHGYEAKFIDYDNDSDLDIVTVCTGSYAPLRLHVYDSNNNIFTQSTYSLPNNEIAYAPFFEFGDINGDGRLDIFIPEAFDVHIGVQNADKSFSLQSINQSKHLVNFTVPMDIDYSMILIMMASQILQIFTL